jgi:non-canonical purine NTP pyrophosphatase (RdgB/HAM1 family)
MDIKITISRKSFNPLNLSSIRELIKFSLSLKANRRDWLIARIKAKPLICLILVQCCNLSNFPYTENIITQTNKEKDMSLSFVTGNPNKFREIKDIITELQQLKMNLVEIQELDPYKVIEAKLKEAQKFHSQELIIEDTSLYFNSMNGLPGPLIKWFLEALKVDGLADLASRLDDQAAEARTIIGYISESGEIKYFEGKLLGRIVAPRGENGFGWDKIFELENGKTLAELSLEEKNKISMRQSAANKLKDFLNL